MSVCSKHHRKTAAQKSMQQKEQSHRAKRQASIITMRYQSVGCPLAIFNFYSSQYSCNTPTLPHLSPATNSCKLFCVPGLMQTSQRMFLLFNSAIVEQATRCARGAWQGLKPLHIHGRAAYKLSRKKRKSACHAAHLHSHRQ